MSSIPATRRSIKLPRLVRLPSKSMSNGESTTSYSDGSSCPNSPAVKKAYRLVVVGSARTGKSAIVNRFLDKGFEDRYLPTIENFHRKLYKIRGEVYQLDVMDRSGNDPFPAARKLSYINGDIFILVSAVDHAESVEQMIEIYSQIIECKTGRVISATSNKKCNGTASGIRNGVSGIINGGCVASSSSSSSISSVGVPPVVFVLNKTDLPAYKWQISMEEVAQMIEHTVPHNHNDAFVACSAALNENVMKVFSRLFTIGKLPKYMNPEMHKMLRNELSADRVTISSHDGNFFNGNGNTFFNGNGSPSVTKRSVLQRMRSKFSKENDDEVIIDVNARRPSLRTDLLLNRAKSAAAGIASPVFYQPATIYDVNSTTTTESFVNINDKHCIIS